MNKKNQVVSPQEGYLSHQTWAGRGGQNKRENYIGRVVCCFLAASAAISSLCSGRGWVCTNR